MESTNPSEEQWGALVQWEAAKLEKPNDEGKAVVTQTWEELVARLQTLRGARKTSGQWKSSLSSAKRRAAAAYRKVAIPLIRAGECVPSADQVLVNPLYTRLVAIQGERKILGTFFEEMAREEAQLAAHEEEERARAAEAQAAGMEGPQIEPEDFLHAWLWPEPPGAVQVNEVSSTEEPEKLETAGPEIQPVVQGDDEQLELADIVSINSPVKELPQALKVRNAGPQFQPVVEGDDDLFVMTDMVISINSPVKGLPQALKLENAGPQFQPVDQGDDDLFVMTDMVSIDSPVEGLPQALKLENAGPQFQPVVQGDDDQLELAGMVSIDSPVKRLPQALKLENAGPQIQPVVQGDDDQLELAGMVSIDSPVKRLPQIKTKPQRTPPHGSGLTPSAKRGLRYCHTVEAPQQVAVPAPMDLLTAVQHNTAETHELVLTIRQLIAVLEKKKY